ncbi:uncharacterized protein PHACADRAFT_260468 [Phanerochaete carnosa HHB-10118-sp]|uniref:DOMON domain-containing protein n=1 Tax=Phanerochaete carnosa (strain HHB-10118-sp) TaxID=650164 RepID=K5W025_PHACS|nr:uncharacterized protein PHACADRAFT_260468 [Phanerochaete carnosa HHB-10118-sp]EKM52234.1 hypothetical protein PHACADRAFT_260468 [Phanerochaete carnosa HHB-10118-sp]
MQFAIIPTGLLSLLLAWCLPAVQGYFIITQPAAGTQWANGAANLVTWTKGVGDGIDGVDIEMSRMSVDGLFFVAKDAPTKPGAINIVLQDIPPANDYYLLFLNSTSGNMFATSSKFSIGSTTNSSATTATSAPTVTVSGSPNPTAVFATTFPPNSNGVVTPGWRAVENSLPQLFALVGTIIMCLLGGAMTLL